MSETPTIAAPAATATTIDTPDTDSHGLEEYAGGYITARHGTIPAWLLVVYTVLFVWAMYYLFTFWGGLGPGRVG